MSFSESFTSGSSPDSSSFSDSNQTLGQEASLDGHYESDRESLAMSPALAEHAHAVHPHEPHSPAAHKPHEHAREAAPAHGSRHAAQPKAPAAAVVSAGPVDTPFSDMPLLETIHQDLRAAGFETPTPIQAACIPEALAGKDVIGLAQTGTGKTAAFAIPIIQKLAHRPELGALVLAPTRELAMQITKVFEELGRSSGVRTATIVGGIPMDKDYKALRSWPNVIVGTPGRLNDHIESGTISLREVEILTVDEADRMHDMGFMPQIRRIIAVLPRERQTMMFTATMPADVERIARSNMRNPLRIQVGVQSAPAHRARQQLFEVSEEDKMPLLLDLLRKSEGRVLVFSRTKRGVDKLARVVNARGILAAKIHGDREQAERDSAMGGFRDGRYRILIATDIAARGIDVENIEHVINYDFPRHAEDYVHRIGRTARQEATGLASSFVTRADRQYVSDVRRLIGDKLPMPVPVAGGQGGERDGGDGHSRRGGDGAPRRGGDGQGRARSHGGQSHRPARAQHSSQPAQSSHAPQAGHGQQAGQASQSAHASQAAQGQKDHASATDSQLHGQTAAAQAAPDQEGQGQGKKRRRRRGGRGRGKGQAQQGQQTPQPSSAPSPAAQAN